MKFQYFKHWAVIFLIPRTKNIIESADLYLFFMTSNGLRGIAYSKKKYFTYRYFSKHYKPSFSRDMKYLFKKWSQSYFRYKRTRIIFLISCIWPNIFSSFHSRFFYNVIHVSPIEWCEYDKITFLENVCKIFLLFLRSL